MPEMLLGDVYDDYCWYCRWTITIVGQTLAEFGRDSPRLEQETPLHVAERAKLLCLGDHCLYPQLTADLTELENSLHQCTGEELDVLIGMAEDLSSTADDMRALVKQRKEFIDKQGMQDPGSLTYHPSINDVMPPG